MHDKAQKLNEVLDQHMPELTALDADKLERPCVSPARARELTRLVCGEFAPLAPLLVRQLKEEPAAAVQRAVQRLPVLADVYHAAELALQIPLTPDQKRWLRELAEVCRVADHWSLAVLWRAREDDPLLRRVLVDLALGSLLRDDASDRLREVKVYPDTWAKIIEGVTVSQRSPDRREAEALELLRLLDAEAKPRPGRTPDLGRRAYTLWKQVYDLVVRTGRYLAWDDPKWASTRSPDISDLTIYHTLRAIWKTRERVCGHWCVPSDPAFDAEILSEQEEEHELEDAELNEDAIDEMHDVAVDIVAEARIASASMLQRRLRIGYNRAARLIEKMESEGLVGPADGAKPRAVLVPPPKDV